MSMNKPILVFGYGNLSRGDDALAPLLLEHLENKADLNQVEILSDFQLQIEHSLDLKNRSQVLFIDASVNCQSAYNFTQLQAIKDKSYSTHAMNPTELLQVYQTIIHQSAPPCFLLSIQGINFELGETLSPQAEDNLLLALVFTQQLLNNPSLDFWSQQQGDYFA